jgi:hypothetical protein
MDAEGIELKDALPSTSSLNGGMFPTFAPNDAGQPADTSVKLSSVVILDSCKVTPLPSDKEISLDSAPSAPIPQVGHEMEVTGIGALVKNVNPGNTDTPTEEVEVVNSCSNRGGKLDWSFLYDEDSHLFRDWEEEMEREGESRAQMDPDSCITDNNAVRSSGYLLVYSLDDLCSGYWGSKFPSIIKTSVLQLPPIFRFRSCRRPQLPSGRRSRLRTRTTALASARPSGK